MRSIEFEKPTKNGCARRLSACLRKDVSFRLDVGSFLPFRIVSSGLLPGSLVTAGDDATAWKAA